MACNSGRDSHTTGRYGENDDTLPGQENGACESGCFRSAMNTEDNSCSACSGNDCVAGCGECSVDCGPKRTCSNSCIGGCTSCSGECSSCSGTCSAGCRGDCSGGCSETCSTACAVQCSNGCTGGCVQYCNYGCSSEAVNELYENLHLSRIAESDDINALKQIIFKLFENLKISNIYNNKDYINEFGDNTIAGLVNNWNENKDGKMTFSLLLNKTFETIIINLNNLNQDRTNIDQSKMNPIKIWTVQIPDPNDFTKTKTIQLNTVDRNAALYWIECLKNIYNLVAPVQ